MITVTLTTHSLWEGRLSLQFRVRTGDIKDRVSVLFDDDTLTGYAIESDLERRSFLNAVHREVARMQESPELAMLRAQLID
jgi:hypothetical protein